MLSAGVPGINEGLNTLTDGESRAVTADGGVGDGTYTYDGNGLRVKKVAGSITTVYIFSGAKVIVEYQNGAAPSSPKYQYVYAGGALLARIDSVALSIIIRIICRTASRPIRAAAWWHDLHP